MTSYFPDALKAGDCEQFKSWLLTQNLAPATIAERLTFARTFFHTARKHKLIDENPFSEVKIPTANVSLRQAFVDRETLGKLFAVANPTWTTIIALSRLGGLRCPSKVLSLKWKHVDWAASPILVPSPKTDRYEGKETRLIPLFADLRSYLEEAFMLAGAGEQYAVGGTTGTVYRAAACCKPGMWKNGNLRTTFEKIICRAGVEPWPRLFHNMRSSCETERMDGGLPIHVVAGWMGHDPKVCLKHYAQTTDDHFDRVTGGAKSGAAHGSGEGRGSETADGNY